ncbi:hypothetical protein Zmor_008730 [Zophobas morio]|uniref:Uncharacterized protein n=1 Tax=Zophobas morio TaxID=2755281 RepID=A0AA38HIM7_9CUCU|nr:hypothetical protein Zmor_008730 [Zophobas morio]
MGDKTDISYVTAAKDPLGNDCVLIGTEQHQYILRSSNKNMGSTDADITLADFDSLDTISNTGTSVATQSYSTAMTNSYGKIYVLDGEKDVHMFQRKVNLSELTSEEVKFADSDITSSTKNAEKAKLIRDKIELGATIEGAAAGSFVSVADVIGGLKAQYGGSDVDHIDALTNFKYNEGDYNKLNFKASNVA